MSGGISPSVIDEWLTLSSESANLEFKEAKNQLSERVLIKYCAAIANAGGGRLVLGVTDAPPRVVVGTAAYPETTGLVAKVHELLGLLLEVSDVEHPEGRVLVLTIPCRQVGIPIPANGRYWTRAGSTTREMTTSDLAAVFAESRTTWLRDSVIDGLSDSEVIELLDTQTFYELVKKGYPTNRSEVLQSLERRRLVAKDGGTYCIRRMGALLLARNLEEFGDLELKAPRLIVYLGKSKAQSRLDHTGRKGYAVGFKGLVSSVMAQLPRNEIIEAALRDEYKLVPTVVVRELIANALVHQDFGVPGRVTIEVYENRLEISNPGIPTIPFDRFIDESQDRNEALAFQLRQLRICENKGSGIDRSFELIEAFQLPPPEFLSELASTRVVVSGPRDFSEMPKQDRIRACFYHCALKWVMREPMSNQTLRERFSLEKGSSGASTTSQIIKDTVDAGLIKPDERAGKSRKFARYIPYWA